MVARSQAPRAAAIGVDRPQLILHIRDHGAPRYPVDLRDHLAVAAEGGSRWLALFLGFGCETYSWQAY